MTSYPTLTKDIIDEMLCGNFHDGLQKAKEAHKHIDETPEEKLARSAKYSANKLTAPMYKGIKELLESLCGAGYILAINTSALNKNCLPLLEYAGINNYFDTVATKEVSPNKIEKFKILEEKYHTNKDSTLFITDTLGDIIEAEAAGVPTIAVTYGAHKRDHFTRQRHNNLVAIVNSVSELKAAIEERFK